jgi:hypothetical protein
MQKMDEHPTLAPTTHTRRVGDTETQTSVTASANVIEPTQRARHRFTLLVLRLRARVAGLLAFVSHRTTSRIAGARTTVTSRRTYSSTITSRKPRSFCRAWRCLQLALAPP